ncbi:MAG TPA: NAD(P)-dependent oxidoreductase [Verrucomicrobiae bacterium]|jgi:nucleoside-diphosphate-sugar epimerase|nr:NAD(P)-dependent oxidoreductase [Verrucomicrobiae bacterium]
MDEFKTNKVIVTGALGWLGISLVQSLVKGLADHEALKQPRNDLRVRCLILPGQDAAPLRKISDRVEVMTGDIRNAGDCARLCEGFEGGILFHTAGIIHPGKVAEFYQINVEGTKQLLDAAISAGIRRAIIVSSNSPCGCNPHNDHLFDENSPYHPYMNYGRSKMQMELAVKEHQKPGKIETVIVRPPWFYGPNQPPRQTLFFQMVRDGKAPIVGSGNNLRSMGYIDNLCQGLMLAALVEKANGQVYWIADKRPYSMNEVIYTIERLLETEFGQKCAHKRMRLPGFASEIALVADKTLQALGLYHQKIHVLSEMNKTIACSVARAEKELGYRPAVSLEEGMRRSMAWCVQQGIKF